MRAPRTRFLPRRPVIVDSGEDVIPIDAADTGRIDDGGNLDPGKRQIVGGGAEIAIVADDHRARSRAPRHSG